MALQQKVMQKFLRVLKDTTSSNPTELLNAAVLACRSRYHTIQEVIDECIYQRTIASSYDEFLKKRCGIDLTNADTGALIGFDACGGNIQTAEDIIPEESIMEWEFPTNLENYYGTLKVIYNSPADADQRFIIGGLHTWWIPRAIHLIADSYGYEFNSPDVTPKELIVRFSAEGQGVLAYIRTVSNLITGKVTGMELVINTDYYVNMSQSNPNGLSLTNPGAGYLDRTVAHEFVHAVEATNIDFFYYLSQNYKWFTEGSAELVHGIDDERIYNITQLMQDQNRFAQAFTQNPVGAEDPYSAGYILLRYFLRQVANGYTQKYRVKRHLMTEKGNVKSLKELGEKFIEFAQKSNNGVQAWQLASHGDNSLKGLSSFYGETLKVPMKNHADIMAEDKYYILSNTIMENTSADIDFIDVLKAQYQKINVTEDYTIGSLDDVLVALASFKDEKSHIIFSGCEGSLLNGDSVLAVINKLKNIVLTVRRLGESRPSLLLTPTADMFNGNTIKDEYKQLLRTSYISRKISMVCLGDSITDPMGASDSWTTYCQEKLPNVNIINKGVAGNTTVDVLNRFNADVVEQVPDICFLLIGGNDLWDADATALANAKINLKQLVDNCISNHITPIIGTYMPTLEQIEQFISGAVSSPSVSDVYDCFKDYYNYSKQLADDYDVLCVDNIYRTLRDIGTGSIIKEDVVSDLIHLETSGKKKAGAYIASCIEDLITAKQCRLSQDYDIINLYDVFCKKLGVEDLTLTQFNALVDNGHYKEGEVLDWITEYIFSEGLFKPFNCPYFYVSLEHMNVEEDTYTKWLRASYDPGKVYAHDVSQFAWDDTKIFYQSEAYNHTKYPHDSSLFKNTGEFIAIGLHTLYDDRLWMCEQGGITCEEEATKQVVDMNWMVKTTSINAKLLPVFPCTGCPWLTISDDNKEEFDVETKGITYWFTKSDYDATITFMVGDGVGVEAYQSISMGMLTNVDDESYLFPLYVAGGTQAISEDIFTYVIPGIPPRIGVITGNRYDLNMKCISMSNSGLLTPTKFNNATISNFKVLAPSGEWKNIFVYQQDTQVKAHPVCPPATPSQYYILLNEVEDITENNHTIMSESPSKVDIYTVNRPLNMYEHSSTLDNIMISFNGGLDIGENGCAGVLPNCYNSWYKTLPVGEVILEGKRYLSVPNGWDKRLWFYPWKVGFYPQGEEDWKADVMQKYWESFLVNNSHKVMNYRLLIPLEEGD